MKKRLFIKNFAVLGIISVTLLSTSVLTFADLNKSITNPGDVKTGWVVGTDNNWRYWRNGTIVTGWFQENSNWYYLNEDGSMVTGWIDKEDKQYLTNPNHNGNYGAIITSKEQLTQEQKKANSVVDGYWSKDERGDWYYYTESEKPYSGWLFDIEAGHWYYLDIDGKMKTGKFTEGKNTYYLKETKGSDIGVLDYGLIEIGNTTFLGNTSHEGSFGAIMKDSWVSLNGKHYYADTTGELVKSKWITKDGKQVYVGEDGALDTSKKPDVGNFIAPTDYDGPDVIVYLPGNEKADGEYYYKKCRKTKDYTNGLEECDYTLDITYKVDKQNGEAKEKVKIEKEFLGWALSSNEKDEDDILIPDEELTSSQERAIRKAIRSYDIYKNDDFSLEAASNETKLKVVELFAIWEDEVIVTPEAPTNGQYKFVGWSTNANATTGKTSISVKNGQTIYAIWDKKSNITNNTDNNGLVLMPNNQDVNATAIMIPAAIDGFVTIPQTDYKNKMVVKCYAANNADKVSIFEKQRLLLGYSTAPTGNAMYQVGSKVEGTNNYSLKLYAIWSQDTLTITLPTPIERKGYQCIGWSSAKTNEYLSDLTTFNGDKNAIIGQPGTSYTATQNIELYPCYEALSNSNQNNSSGLYLYNVNNATNEITVTGLTEYGKTLTTITIPDSINGKSVVALAGTFKDNHTIKNVQLPATLKTIGEMTFYGAENLLTVSISEGVTEIDDSAFMLCSSLTSIKLPYSLEKIGKSVFKQCTSLKSIILHEALTSLGKEAFANCTSLNYVGLENQNLQYDESVFMGCTLLSDSK